MPRSPLLRRLSRIRSPLGTRREIESHRHLPGKDFIAGLNRRLIGHDNDDRLRGNLSDLWRFHTAVVVAALQWPNRRGGKRRSHTWDAFKRACKRLGVARPRLITPRSAQRDLVLA